MEFGLSVLPDTGPDERSGHDYYDNLLAISRLADNLGLEYLKMTEHYMHSYGGYCPSPLIFLSAAAAVTDNIRLMTGGIQASFHHPIQIAAQTAQLDAISGGRLDVGFARAFLPYEFEAFGIDMDTSTERFRQTVLAVVRLWTEQKVTEDNPFFQYSDVTSFPPPTQKPHPPTWAAALLTRSSFEWIGDQGFNLLMASPPRPDDIAKAQEMIQLYRDRFDAAVGTVGVTGKKKSAVAVSVPLLIRESDDEATEYGRRLLRIHHERFSEAAASWSNHSSPAYAGYQDSIQKKFGSAVDDNELDSTSIFGSPSTVVDKVHQLQQTLGPDVILWQIDFGQQPLEQMQQTLNLFAQQVRPHL